MNESQKLPLVPLEQGLDACGTPYPTYVSTDEERHRWNTACELARALFDGDKRRAELIWATTRVLYRSDIPT